MLRLILAALALLTIGGAGTIRLFTRESGMDASGLAKGSVTYQQLLAHPEARLYFPGSEVVHTFGLSEYRHPFSGERDRAFAGAVLATSAPWAEIFLWYRHWLLARGWRGYETPRLDVWIQWKAYACGTREEFTVAQENPKLLGMTLGRTIPKAQRIYEIRFGILPYGMKHAFE